MMYASVQSSEPLQKALSQLFGDRRNGPQQPQPSSRITMTKQAERPNGWSTKKVRQNQVRIEARMEWGCEEVRIRGTPQDYNDTMRRNILQMRARKLKEAELRMRRDDVPARSGIVTGPSSSLQAQNLARVQAAARDKMLHSREPQPSPNLIPKIHANGDSKNAVIIYDGKSYELTGVPLSMNGQQLRIDWDYIEPNLIYFYYHGNATNQSAVILPKPKDNSVQIKDPSRLVRKPAIRLAAEEDTREEAFHKNLSAVDFIRMMQNTR